MTQQTISVGSAINDGTGDPARTAFTKSNDNFTELYQRAPQCGRLVYVSATALKFSPFNGNQLKVNGSVLTIPNAGITGLANTGVFVNGTGSSNLAANTVYWIFAFSNAGTLTADFRTAATHVPSSTAGNEGVEILSGNDTRTLIGMCRTNSSSQFAATANYWWVLSWFNRRSIAAVGLSTGGATTASTSYITLTAVADSPVYFLTWGDEIVTVNFIGTVSGSVLCTVDVQAGLNGSLSPLLPISITGSPGSAGAWSSAGGAVPLLLSEGFNFITPLGKTNAGTATFYVVLSATIRG